MRVMVVEPEKKPYVKEIAGDLESLQKEVDGYIEAVYPWDEPCAIVCDEESKLTGIVYYEMKMAISMTLSQERF